MNRKLEMGEIREGYTISHSFVLTGLIGSYMLLLESTAYEMIISSRLCQESYSVEYSRQV